MAKAKGASPVRPKMPVQRMEPIKTARRNVSVTQDANGEAQVQLATRVNKALYRELKLYCVTNHESISNMVGVAISDLLTKRGWKMKKAS